MYLFGMFALVEFTVNECRHLEGTSSSRANQEVTFDDDDTLKRCVVRVDSAYRRGSARGFVYLKPTYVETRRGKRH